MKSFDGTVLLNRPIRLHQWSRGIVHFPVHEFPDPEFKPTRHYHASRERPVSRSVENGGGRPARYALARRRVVIFFSVGYSISPSYEESVCTARCWVKRRGQLPASENTRTLVEGFILNRANVSLFSADKEIRHLRSTFNFGSKRKLTVENPLGGISFLLIAFFTRIWEGSMALKVSWELFRVLDEPQVLFEIRWWSA